MVFAIANTATTTWSARLIKGERKWYPRVNKIQLCLQCCPAAGATSLAKFSVSSFRVSQKCGKAKRGKACQTRAPKSLAKVFPRASERSLKRTRDPFSNLFGRFPNLFRPRSCPEDSPSRRLSGASRGFSAIFHRLFHATIQKGFRERQEASPNCVQLILLKVHVCHPKPLTKFLGCWMLRYAAAKARLRGGLASRRQGIRVPSQATLRNCS